MHPCSMESELLEYKPGFHQQIVMKFVLVRVETVMTNTYLHKVMRITVIML